MKNIFLLRSPYKNKHNSPEERKEEEGEGNDSSKSASLAIAKEGEVREGGQGEVHGHSCFSKLKGWSSRRLFELERGGGGGGN